MEQIENTDATEITPSMNPLTESRAQVDTGLRILFEEMQHNFITRSRKDIAIELKKMENRATLLQDKINSLHNEVDRLSAIDLDTEFRQMQGTLVHIANAVNNINASLGNAVSGVGANMGDSLSNTNATIRHYAEEAANQLSKLDEETKTNIRFLEHKVQSLTEQNKSIRRSATVNNVITIIGLLLTLGGIAYIIAWQAGVRINF